MPKFNKDILFLVFEELQDNIKSLFSCLMVNRIWCESAIPILWKNPWCYDINYSNKNSLFIIIAIYLSDNIKEFEKYLTRQGTQLLSISPKYLLFDYLSFCRSFNVPVLNNLISIGSSKSYNQFLLQEFYGIMIRKCPGFRCLNIEMLKHQTFYFLEDKARLGSLCELKCDTSIDSSHFNELVNVCNFIQRLIIINNCLKVNNGIVNLIKVQKNLKYFEWKDNFKDNFDEDFEDDPYEKIFLALEKHANTLNFLIVSLQFIESNNIEPVALQHVLTKLHKLKTLIITGDVFMTFSDGQLRNMVYRELEIFNIELISISEVSIIIENSGGHLKEIPLNYEYYERDDDPEEEESLIFIRQIYEKCPLIENLSLIFLSSKQYFTEFEKLLKGCKNLESLILRIENTDEEETREELLNTLIRSAPTNINEIKFLNKFEFPLESLEKFLEGWKGRHAISIYTSNPIHKENSYMNLVNRYKNIGVIKNFICES